MATPSRSAATSLLDIWLVARFELLRNLRTWRALALCLMYLIATGGATYLFTRFIHELETALASTLGVPATETPGAMLDQLLKEESLQTAITRMVGDASTAQALLDLPILALFHLWIGMGLIPFLAAATSSESIVLDTANRAIRFETLRTGRVELVVGRYLGQLLLLMGASLLSILATFGVGMIYMVGNDPARLIAWLVIFTPRLWLVSLPYLGMGLAASQMTSSANMARVAAMSAVILSWILYGQANRWLEDGGGVIWDVVLQITPQVWMKGLWQPGVDWLSHGTVLVLMGLAYMAVGLPVFLKRDL